MAHFLFLLLVLSSINNILASEIIRDSRSIGSTISESKLSSEINNGKTIQRLVGGHVKNSNENSEILFMESAGDKSKDKRKDDDDEEKKTLSQQVADGKYGLIQKEIFAKPPKSQGIISYNKNPEVPKDTKKNLGGLEPSDIWLAEDHLLVLKGGLFPEHNSKDDIPPNWPPIDDFKAPRRQVKIPKNPKIPPPFPVQLHDNGPIEFIGINGSARPLPQNYGPPYPQHGFVPGSGPFFPQPGEFNFTNNGETPFPLPPYGYPHPGNFSKGGGQVPFPFLPPGQVNRGKPGQQLPPFIASLPPGAVYLPPPQNKTELYDEDDPSIYYPPPYSFFYPKDNSSRVPAGPLVPGIILPPPPDFFAPENGQTTTSESPPTTTETYTQIYPTQTTKPETSSKPIYKPPVLHQITKPIYVSNNLDSPEKIRLSIPTNVISDEPDDSLQSITTPTPPVQTPIPIKSTLKQTVPVDNNYYYTTEPGISIATFNLNSATPPKKSKIYVRPTIPSTSINYDYPENYYENNAVSPNPRPFSPYETEKQRSRYNSGRTIVSTTAIPLKAYFTTPIIETNPISSDPLLYYQQRQGSLATRQSPKIKSQAAYYYYEEDSKSTTPTPQYNEYYEAANLKQTAPQYFPQSDDNQNRQQYYIVAAKNNGRNNGQYYTTPRQRYQLYDTTLRPQLINSQLQQLRQELQSYLSSTRFKSNFEQTTSKPVYEYSFQSADYASKNFRNQQSNDDPFRPIVGFNQAYQTTPSPFAYEKPVVKQNGYYSTPNPRFEYPETGTISPLRQGAQRPQQYQSPFLNVRPTPNPNDQSYYTKQEEGLLDDITKQYFTVFGQKIADAKDLGITIPIRNSVSTTVRPQAVDSDEQYIDPALQNVQNVESIEVHFGDNSQSAPNDRRKPISLASDTLVNYRNPRPKINPNSEFIPIVNPHSQYTQNQLSHEQVISLESDIDVNNKFPRPPNNPDAEVFRPIKVNPNAESLEQHNYYPQSIETLNRPIQGNSNNGKIITNGYIQQHPLNSQNRNVGYQNSGNPIIRVESENQKIRNGGEGQPGSFISYKLPGNGAHFYFLTPQAVLAKQKQEISSGYIFSEPNQRLRRSRIRQKDHTGTNGR